MKKILQKHLLTFALKSHLLMSSLKNLHIQINVAILYGCELLVREKEIQVLRAVTVNVTLCSVLKCTNILEAHGCLQLQCWRVNQSRNLKEASSLISIRHYGIISQKTIFFTGCDFLGKIWRNHKIWSSASTRRYTANFFQNMLSYS
jgi:hypothetical protein